MEDIDEDEAEEMVDDKASFLAYMLGVDFHNNQYCILQHDEEAPISIV